MKNLQQQVQMSDSSNATLSATYSTSITEYYQDPHQAVEIERAIIGAVLLEKRAINEALMTVTAESFFDRTNAIIFDTVTQMWSEGEPIDLLTVSNRLQQKGLLVQIGGTAHLAGLTQKVGSAAHIEHHARIVQQNYIARTLVAMGMKLTNIAADKFGDIADILDECTAIFDSTIAACIGRGSAQHIGLIASDALKALEQRERNAKAGIALGIPTGIGELDRILGGLQPLLYVVAARPSMGKTAFMISMTLAAAWFGKSACVYSLEMSSISLVNRFLLTVSGVDVDRFRSGRVDSEDWRKLEKARAELSRMKIYIDPSSGVTIDYIASHSQQRKNQGKCDIIFIDYLQFIETTTARGSNRNEEVGKISRRAKRISKVLQVPVVLLSQLSREVEKRPDKRPILSDLRDSGNIEQDADIVAFLHRPAYYGKMSTDSRRFGNISTEGLMEVIIAKQRDGAIGSIPVRHDPAMRHFEDWTHTPRALNPASTTDTDNADLPF